MSKAGRSSSRVGEEGFTLLEVLVGMVILSALGIGVWAAVTVSLQSVARLRASTLATAQVLQVDDRLRSCALRVRAPWWEPSVSMQSEEASWRIPYLDGDPGKVLVISWSDSVLSIEDGVSMSRYTGFTSARVAPALDGQGKAYGMELTLEGRYVGRISVIARYGSAELPRSSP